MWPSEMAMDRVGVEVAYVEVIPADSGERPLTAVDDV
jgi:hypothetical protein